MLTIYNICFTNTDLVVYILCIIIENHYTRQITRFTTCSAWQIHFVCYDIICIFLIQANVFLFFKNFLRPNKKYHVFPISQLTLFFLPTKMCFFGCGWVGWLPNRIFVVHRSLTDDLSIICLQYKLVY